MRIQAAARTSPTPTSDGAALESDEPTSPGRSPASGTRGVRSGVVRRSSPRRSAATAASEPDANVYSPPSVPRPGVGSNGTQPIPANHTSTHACAS